MNTVGPYHNRQETYSYFMLPFCHGPKKAVSHYHENIGEALQGTELEYSGIDIRFKGAWSKPGKYDKKHLNLTDFAEDIKSQEYCSVVLDKAKYVMFKYAVKHHYWYQMYLDDLPSWALVGDFGSCEC